MDPAVVYLAYCLAFECCAHAQEPALLSSMCFAHTALRTAVPCGAVPCGAVPCGAVPCGAVPCPGLPPPHPVQSSDAYSGPLPRLDV